MAIQEKSLIVIRSGPSSTGPLAAQFRGLTWIGE
jgi:hypothetical protein